MSGELHDMSGELHDRWLKQALAGQALAGELIVDSHVHLGEWMLMHVPWREWDDTLRTMDRIGIRFSIVNGILHPDYKEGNSRVGELVRAHPDRVIGAAAFNPFYGQAAMDELVRCFEGLGFKGIKIHEMVTRFPFSSSYDPGMLEPMLDFAAERACPILYHGLISESMIRDHPRVNFICAHGPADIEQTLRLAKYENFHVDTAYTVVLTGTFEAFVTKLGAHRILFGSDAPLSSPSFRLGQVLSARISDSAVSQVLGLNAARLYGIPARSQEAAPAPRATKRREV
jgi:predicted TIM-barrel fold metal-dependent hydrolase